MPVIQDAYLIKGNGAFSGWQRDRYLWAGVARALSVFTDKSPKANATSWKGSSSWNGHTHTDLLVVGSSTWMNYDHWAAYLPPFALCKCKYIDLGNGKFAIL